MESVKVIIRVRPVNETEMHNCGVQISEDNKVISIDCHRQISCRYDHICRPNTLQKEVYSHVNHCVESILEGYNSTIMAYGQTGSGKSHSMFGKNGNIRLDPGVIPRSVRHIFAGLANKSKTLEGFIYSVHVSFVQVYNDQVYDMFDSSFKPLAVHTRNMEVEVPNLSDYKVRDFNQCLALIDLGLRNRNVRETVMNHVSSRSHSILQVKIEQSWASDNAGERKMLQSKFNLVDLAGSEKWTSSNSGRNMGEEQIAELTKINSSLHTLGRCIAALATKSRERGAMKSPAKHIHVPFRDSKLTRILQDGLSGGSKICLLATINPSDICADDSIGTLRFADRAHQVMTHAQLNERETSSDTAEVNRLRNEVVRLTSILQAHGLSMESPPQDSSGFRSPVSLIPFRTEIDPSQSDPSSVEAFDAQIRDDESCSINEPVREPNESSPRISPLTNNAACKKIIQLLTSILLVVDSFMSTMSTSTSGVERPLRSGGSDNHETNNVKDQSNKREESVQSNETQVQEEVKVAEGKKRYSNIPNPTTRYIPTPSSKPPLSVLLKRRKQMQKGPKPVDANTSRGRGDDTHLEKDLFKTKERLIQKQQLRQWLLEREAKAEDPFNSILTGNHNFLAESYSIL